jgi:integration host factor subunit alpha
MSEKTVTRAELTSAIYQESTLSQQEAAVFVDTFFEEIIKVLANDEIVKIAGLGTFNLRHKKARVGRNPKTGVEVVITPRTVVSFKASKLIKQKINHKDSK